MWGASPFGAVPWGSGGDEGDISLSVSDGIVLSTSTSNKILPYLIDTLHLGGATTTQLNAFNAVVDSFGIQTATLVAWSMFATSSVDFSTTTAYTNTVVLAAIDILLASGLVSNQLEAHEAVVDAIAAHTLAALKFSIGATDSIAFSDALTNALNFAVQLVATVVLQDTVVPTLHCLLLASSSLAAVTTLSSVLYASEAVVDGIGLFINVRLDTGDFSGWVLNTEARGVTEYRNFEFNSFAPAFGSYYAGSDDGLYELVGDDDAGTPIDAWIRSALTNLGSDVLKNAPAMYVGLTADESLVLKVVLSNDPATGGKREFWYTSPPKAAASSQGTRFEPGKGLEAVYWQWELHNQDGGDFSINVVSWYPVMYTRRV
jgi:hypothetical protein